VLSFVSALIDPAYFSYFISNSTYGRLGYNPNEARAAYFVNDLTERERKRREKEKRRKGKNEREGRVEEGEGGRGSEGGD
jgi:hypothetical protein